MIIKSYGEKRYTAASAKRVTAPILFNGATEMHRRAPEQSAAETTSHSCCPPWGGSAARMKR